MDKRSCLLALVIAFSLGGLAPAFAKSGEAQKSLGTFAGWRTFTFQENHEPVCYMALTVNPPAKAATKHENFSRGIGHLIITHRPADNSKDVVSFAAGYLFQPEKPVTIHIGKSTFELFTTNNTAWARDAVTDHKLASAIRQNTVMTITGTPVTKNKKITAVTERLNLTGAPKAYQAIGKACGYETEELVTKTTKPRKKTKSKP